CSSTRKARSCASAWSRDEQGLIARSTVTPAGRRATRRTERTNGQTRRTNAHSAKLSLEQLVRQIKDGEVDTVILAISDLQGRPMGKRLTGAYFLDHVDEGLDA